jgi:MGT family glycosyltransferase
MQQQYAEPRRFLFTLWEGGGNVPPQLAIARRLRDRGHDVRVMSDACNAAEVQAAGAEFVAYTRAPNRRDKSAASTLLKDYEAKNPLQAFLVFRDGVMVDPALAYAQDVLDELDRAPADLLVVNDGLLGALMAAESAGIPCAMLLPHHYIYPAEGLPPPGMMTPPPRNMVERLRDRLINAVIIRAFDGAVPKLNATRAALGLPPLAHLLDHMHRADRVLVLTSPSFDYRASSLPANVRYVGPVLDDPFASDAPPPLPAGDAPLVVVGFSTTFQNQQPIVQRVIDAIGELPVRGLVTAGPALADAQFRVPANVTLQGFVPHGALFPHAAAVVTHAGHGTVIRALAHGVPLVCIPMGRDQNGNAARVAAHGAGLALSPGASVAELRRAIGEAATRPHYREQARRLGEQIAHDARSSLAIAELEALAMQEVALTPVR